MQYPSANISCTIVVLANFSLANCKGSIFDDAYLLDINVTDTALSNVKFDGARVEGSILEGIEEA